MNQDAWKTIMSFGTDEASRMRHCRGCIYLGTAGNYGCCNYWEIADRRRPCKFGTPDCPAKIPIPGYKIPPEHDEFCKRVDYQEQRRKAAEARQEKIRLERIERMNREINKQAIEDPYGMPQRKDPRGRTANWDMKYAFQLYMEGYYMFEIAEILETTTGKVSACARNNGWSKFLPPNVERFRHGMEQAKADYAEYKRKLKEASNVAESALSEK